MSDCGIIVTNKRTVFLRKKHAPKEPQHPSVRIQSFQYIILVYDIVYSPTRTTVIHHLIDCM